MKPIAKIGILTVLMVAAGIIVVIKQGGAPTCCPHTIADNSAAVPTAHTVPIGAGLPRLVDLGASKCIPCKMMKPILDELTVQYKDRFEVVFIDVWENPKAADPYNINLIPTQIFFDKDGKEQFRHEGFFSKDNILAKWKELGVQ